MKKRYLNSISLETENTLIKLSDEAITSNLKKQKQFIRIDSPYSDKINKSISNYKEFLLYYNLKLKEAMVTRPSLIKDIDLDLWISCENKTNRQLLEKGLSPYAYDSVDGKIEIHHIGQDYDSPFAELTTEEHVLYGNSKVLHNNAKESWRNDESKTLAFQSERALYWKLRSQMNYKLIPMKKFCNLEPRTFSQKEELSISTQKALEMLFAEASIDDLNYISNLANSYIMVKQMGSKTIEDFINNETSEEKITCSFCGEANYTLHGNYKTSDETIKRYKCKKCGKSFTQVNNSIISGSNMSFIEWLRFIDCLYNGYSVIKTAEICNLSNRAVQTNRYKLFYALKILDDNVKLSGNVVIDETYINVSYKGNHSSEKFLPRKARKRGGENHTPGTSKEKVCIVCALDDNGNSVARIGGCGNPNANRLYYSLRNTLDKENIISLYSDKEKAMMLFAERNGYPLQSAMLIKKRHKVQQDCTHSKEDFIVNNYLQRINSYHSRLKKFTNNFSGLSSTYLAGYLYLFAWKERNKTRDKYEAYKELFGVLTSRNTHISGEDLCNGTFLPNPFVVDKMSEKTFTNQKQADDIYALHAKGLKNVEIAKIYKMTPQGIGRIIRKYNALNLGYKTEKEKKKEQYLMEQNKPEGYRKNKSDVFVELYHKRQAWSGTANSFITAMMEEYNLSRQTIKNQICIGRRIVALQNSFFINDTFEYSTLRELYQTIYDEFLELRKNRVQKNKCYSLIATKHGFVEANVMRIIKIMNGNVENYFSRKNIRLSPTETINRDKAMFVDYLRWRGSKENFYLWASEKYNVSQQYVTNILFYCLSADPKRYDMIYATVGISGKPKK